VQGAGLLEVLAMLRRLSDEQKECMERAAEAHQRADASANSADRETFLDMEKRWLDLARSYGYVEQLQTFLGNQRTQLASIIGDSHSQLTRRELEVLEMTARGLSYVAMAAGCGISQTTIHSHLKSIYRKLGVHSKTQAIFQARVRGLIR
jgi:DNA-binding CsgD family transcriptional regulator